MSFRIGFGFDVHQLVPAREFWIGGILIPHEKGALGHSDADVLIHAICDAMLGAAALGDIGLHFPDTDINYKGIDSKILLKNSYDLVKAAGWKINNIDSTVCLEKPKLRPYIDNMRSTLAVITGLAVNEISIKATTNEKLGFIGREDGIAAYAIVMLTSV